MSDTEETHDKMIDALTLLDALKADTSVEGVYTIERVEDILNDFIRGTG